MDEWSKQFFRSLDSMAQETERWWQDVADQLAAASETFVQTTDEWAEQVQEAIAPEVERILGDIHRLLEPLETEVDVRIEETTDHLNEVLDPVINDLVSNLDLWFERAYGPINSTVEPILQDHPTCVGCRHYYGQAHGGNMLICAMHPFGPEAENCSDWETFWPGQDDSSL